MTNEKKTDRVLEEAEEIASAAGDIFRPILGYGDDMSESDTLLVQARFAGAQCANAQPSDAAWMITKLVHQAQEQEKSVVRVIETFLIGVRDAKS